MAENKQDLPVTPIEDKPQETPEEKVEEPKEELIDESNEVIAEFLEEEPVKEVEKSEDEKVETPEEEEKPLETTVEPKEPEVPLEEVVEEVREDEREKVKEKILEAIGIGKEEKKLAEETGFKFAWEKRGEDKPASWKENNEETIRLYKASLAQEQADAKKEQERINQLMQVANKEVNEKWNKQIDWLEESGEIPATDPKITQRLREGKVLTKAERNDPGIKAQKEIFDKMYDLDLLSGGKGTRDAIHVYTRYIKSAKSKKPAGAKAPVSGGRTPLSTGTEEITYDEVHNQDFDQIVANQ